MKLHRTDSLVTAQAVADRFGVTVPTVLKWVREQRIPCVRASRKVLRFDLAAVEASLVRERGGQNG